MSNPPTISLAMIARDREAEIKLALESVRPHVDQIVVVEAGVSTDNTVAVAKSFGAEVYSFTPETSPAAFYQDVEERFTAWKIPGPYSGRAALADFSAPRNLSFSKCTSDYIFWMDSDDVLLHPEKLRDIVSKIEAGKIEIGLLPYEYEHDEAGNCTTRQIRERIIRRADFESGKITWTHPIHEILHGMTKGMLFEDLVMVHKSPVFEETVNESGHLKIVSAQRDRVYYRNLKNLIIEFERAPEKVEPWIFYYLGTELLVLDPERAVGFLQKYITLSERAEERSQARLHIARVRELQLRNEDAWDLFAGAALEYPANPTSWFGLARMAFVRGNDKQAVEFSERGFDAVNNSEQAAPRASLVLNPLEWRYRAHVIYSKALLGLRRYTDALASCKKGLAVSPECIYLREHAREAQEALAAASPPAAIEVAA